MKLGSKLILQTVLPALTAVVVLLIVVTQVAGTALQDTSELALAAVADARREEVRGYFERMHDDIVATSNAPAVISAIKAFSAAFAACAADTQLQQIYDNGGSMQPHGSLDNACHSGYEQAHAKHDKFFRQRHDGYGWYDMLLVDTKGNVVYSVQKEKDFATNLLNGAWQNSGLARAAGLALRSAVSGVSAFSDAEPYQPSANRPAMFLAIPVLDPGSGRSLGVVAARIAFEPLDRLMHFKAGLGDTGEAFIVGSSGWLLTNTFFDKEHSVLKRQLKTDAVQRVLAGNEGNEQLADYRGQQSFIAYRSLRPFPGALGDQPHWGVIAKISRDEALARLNSLQWLMIGSGLLLALAATAYGVIVGRGLFSPVLAIRDALTRLANGEKTPIPGLERRDEIGEMAQAAEKFRALSESVARDRWIREHVAALTTGVSQETRLARVPDILLGLLRRHLDVPVASLFLRDAAGNYRRAGAQGLARRSQAEDSFSPGESLIGECARDGQAVILSPVPTGLALISTGLTEFPPEEVVIYPIRNKDETLAVVELAATRRLSPDDHAFLAALVEPLGLQLANIEASERNLALLEESRAQADTLSRQKSELAQKNTEMQALGDEMRGQAAELRAQNDAFRANQEELRAQQEELAHQNQVLEAQGQQLEASRREAESRARELTQSNLYKSQFLANMSHELRTPLNSILILAKHLAENSGGRLEGDEVESATVIHESGNQLLSLINDILDLSRIEAGKLEMLFEDFPVADMLLYLRRLFEPLAAKKAIGFAIDTGETDWGIIRSDRRHLTQVLTNLLSNAVKFTDHGEVRLSVRAGEHAGGELCFAVSDTGIGIAADNIAHIFGAFQQVDGGTARKYGGSGLGLAISRQLVELLGGRLAVDSKPGIGSCFSAYLPRLASGAQPAAPVAAIAAPAPAAASRATILVVEDDHRLLPIVIRLIEALGYDVSAAESGERALELIPAVRPAGVLLDLGLPGISGMEVLRRIKSDPASAALPVYIMSGAANTGEAQTLGALGYIRKPITRDAVLGAIRSMLATTPAPLDRQRVLLVEDDEACSLAVRVLFKDTDIDFVVRRGGSSGLAALESDRFSAVILDLTLPDMSGFEWLERMAASTRRHPPVIVYSARDLDDGELLRLRVHADAVIAKGRLNGQTSARLREELLLALAAPARETAAATTSERRGALLIVDDDVRSQSALSKVLRSRGFTVSVATSGAQALEVLAASHFDALLTDIMMPEMDGLELIRRLRSDASAHMAKLPIIAVTAKAMSGDVDLCLAAGASDYLAKPVDVDRLLALLEKWL